jgi:hypothetical protein
MALHFNKDNDMCDLRNITDFKIQANKTLWNTALLVHVKDGVNLETNGTYIA